KAAQKEKEKEEAPEKEASEAPDTPLPLLDLSDAAVKKLIRTAKKRGYVTHDQINSVLPSEEVNSEQIEDVLAMFSEMGVNVVETEEATDEEEREEAEEEPESDGGDLVEVQRAVPAKAETKPFGTAPLTAATPVLAQTPAPPAAPPNATPFKVGPAGEGGEDEEPAEAAPPESEFDDEDMENSLSLAAIEAELKPKVLET